MPDEDLLQTGGESQTEGGEAQAEPNLRDVIAASIASQKDEFDAEQAQREGKPPPAPTAPPKDPVTGKFLKAGAPANDDKAAKPRRGTGRQSGVQYAPQGQQPANQNTPPHGWSVEGKQSWAQLPPHVQADIARREQEVNQGLARLSDYRGVDRFADAARQSGTTLENALTAYTSIESLLRSDPAQGFIEILRNIRMHPGVVLQEVMRRLGGTPTGQPANQNGQGYVPAELQNQVNALTNYVQNSIRERDQTNLQMAHQEVAQFWADPRYPFAENVAPRMVAIINRLKDQGQRIDLASVYDEAVYSDPTVRELLINERLSSGSASVANRNAAIANSARSAARAVTGAPAAGFSPAQRAPNSNESLRDTIQAAVDAQKG